MIHASSKKVDLQSVKSTTMILLSAVILIFLTGCQTLPGKPIKPVTIALPDKHPVTIRNSPTFSVSADGKHIVFVADIDEGDGRQLMLLPVEVGDSRLLDGTTGAETPFFSPDNQWIGFFANNKLKKISLSNYEIDVIADAIEPKGGFWGINNTIVYSTGSIWSISADGGTPRQITQAEQDEQHYWPTLTTDNSILFYNSISSNDTLPDVVMVNIESGQKTTLLTNGNYPRFMGHGRLLFVDNGGLKSVKLNLDTLSIEDQPVHIQEDVLFSPNTGAGQYSVSNLGELVYIEGRIFGNSRKVVFLNNKGIETDPGYPLARNSYVRFSPDASLLAIESEPDVLVYDAVTKSMLYRIENASYPVWGPGRNDITYTWVRPNQSGLYSINIETGIRQGPLVFSRYPVNHSYSWSKDGENLLYTVVHEESGMDIWLKRGSLQPRPLFESDEHECCGTFSPDGQWIAYVRGDPGAPEVFISSLPSLSKTYMISTNGGREPMWSADGLSLYYWEDRKFQKVTFKDNIGQNFTHPQTITEGIYVSSTSTWRPRYDIHPDKESYVIIRRGPEEMGVKEIQWLPGRITK